MSIFYNPIFNEKVMNIMLKEEQVLSDIEIKKRKRKIVKDFLKDKNLSKFEKEALKTLEGGIYGAYTLSYKDTFYDYLKDNEKALQVVLADLDAESKNVVHSILKDAEYYNTHNLLDLYIDFYKKEDEIIDLLEKMKSYSHLKLPAIVYEQCIFEYHHGLIYLPERKIMSLNNMDFIDCGGYIGDSALVFETFYNPKKIYSFEPDEENFYYFLETIKLNNLKKVVPLKFGVGAKDHTANIVSLASASYITSDEGNNEIKITSIDNFVNERNLSVGLIKMDIEGYELEALEGARKTIEEFKPVLLISNYHNAEQFINVVKFIQDLTLDYNIIIRHLGGHVPIAETHVIAW